MAGGGLAKPIPGLAGEWTSSCVAARVAVLWTLHSVGTASWQAGGLALAWPARMLHAARAWYMPSSQALPCSIVPACAHQQHAPSSGCVQ